MNIKRFTFILLTGLLLLPTLTLAQGSSPKPIQILLLEKEDDRISKGKTELPGIPLKANGEEQKHSRWVGLEREPTSGSVSVKVKITGGLITNLTAQPNSLTFNKANWNKPREVVFTYDGQGETGQGAEIVFSGNGLADAKIVGTNIGVVRSGSETGTDQGSSSTTTNLGDTKTKAFGGKQLGDYISDPNGFVYPSWRASRSIINVLLIIALLLISFTNILRINIDTYTVKKALPNLILGVILANVSFLVVRYLADITTVVTYLFVNLAGQATFSGFLIKAIESISETAIYTVSKGFYFMLLIFSIISFVGLLWMAFLLYFRLVAIYLLTILAPLAFIAYGVPGFEKYFKLWWQQFIKWLFIVPAMSAVFWLMIEIGQSTPVNSWAKLLLMYVLFFTAVTLPSKMGGAVIDKASKAFMKYTGAGAARDASLKAGENYWNDRKEVVGLRLKQLGYRLPGGGIVARNAAAKEMNREAMKGDIENLKTIGKTGATESGAGTRLAKVNKRKEELGSNLETAQSRAEQRAYDSGALEKAFDKVFHGGKPLSVRLVEADYNKIEAKGDLDAKKARVKLEFQEEEVDDGHGNKKKVNGDFLRKVQSAVNQAEQLSKAIERSEGIMKGELATEELLLTKHAAQYAKYQKEYDEEVRTHGTGTALALALQSSMGEIEDDYNRTRIDSTTGRVKAGLETFGSRSISAVARDINSENIESKIFDAKLKQSRKAVESGMVARTEDDKKNQSIEELDAETQRIVSELGANYTSLLQGDTLGVSASDQGSFSAVTQKLIAWAGNRNDYRRDDALKRLSMMHLNGKGAYTFNDSNGAPVNIRDEATFDAFMATAKDEDKRRALNHIASNNSFLIGSPSFQHGHINT